MHIKRIRLALWFSVVFMVMFPGNEVIAQSDGTLSLYARHLLSLSPAAVSDDESIDIGFSHRSQWIGIPGNPHMQYLSLTAPLLAIQSNTGLVISNEIIGAERNTGIAALYAYKIYLKKNNYLSFGIQAGIVQKALDGNKLRAPEGEYNNGVILSHNDDYIPETKQSGFAPAISAGIYFNSRNFYLLGAVKNLYAGKTSLQTPTAESRIGYSRTALFSAGYTIQYTTNWKSEIFALIKSEFKTVQADFGVTLIYKSNLWGGISLRGYDKNSLDALGFMMGFNLLNNLRFGYGYDVSLSSLGRYNSGSHEMVVNYSIPLSIKVKPGKVIYNPRFL